jgi:hypothetical protein
MNVTTHWLPGNSAKMSPEKAFFSVLFAGRILPALIVTELVVEEDYA